MPHPIPERRTDAPPGSERLRTGLTPEQAQAAIHGTRPLLPIAGSGGGSGDRRPIGGACQSTSNLVNQRRITMNAMTSTARKLVAGNPTVTYTATFTPGEDGWICAQVVELPEAISQGRILEEAKGNVAEALEAAIAWRVADGEPLPEPGQVIVGPVTVAQP